MLLICLNQTAVKASALREGPYERQRCEEPRGVSEERVSRAMIVGLRAVGSRRGQRAENPRLVTMIPLTCGRARTQKSGRSPPFGCSARLGRDVET